MHLLLALAPAPSPRQLRHPTAQQVRLSAYELLRLERVRENNAVLAALNIVPLAGKPDARMAAARRKRSSVAEASVPPSRSSTRLAELPRPNYVEEPVVRPRVLGSSSATSVPKPPGRPPRGADGASCTWDGQVGCWRERDGSQRPPGRAACTRQHRKRRVDRVETTPRREPTAAGEAEQRVTVSVLGGREGCEPADCLPPLPPPLQRDIARRAAVGTYCKGT